MKKNKNRGITLASLVITIIVLLIIAGISVYSGTDIIKRAELEELKTKRADLVKSVRSAIKKDLQEKADKYGFVIRNKTKAKKKKAEAEVETT